MGSQRKNSLEFPKQLLVDKGKDFFDDFPQFFQGVAIHIYHTCSETQASFAERDIRSLKAIIQISRRKEN